MLDSVQGRSPNLAFLPCVSLPELETWIETWSFVETVHSRSYTYLIRNVYSNPSEVFDEILGIKEISACADDIVKHYNDLMRLVNWYNLLGEGSYSVICKDNTRAKIEITIANRWLPLCCDAVIAITLRRLFIYVLWYSYDPWDAGGSQRQEVKA